MKKYSFLLCALFFCVSAFAEPVLGTYYCSYFKKSFDVQISDKDESGNFTLYVGTAGDSKRNFLFFRANSSGKSLLDGKTTIDELSTKLDSLKSIFGKYIQTAKDNNVTKYTKEITDSYFAISPGFCWTGYDTYFGRTRNLQPKFMVINGEPIIMYSAEVASTSNEYITNQFYFVFGSVEEISEFQKLISKESTDKFFNKQQNVDDLFQ